MRTFSSLVKAALGGAAVVSRFVVRIYVPGATYYATDAPTNFSWDNGDGTGAHTYVGFGEALRVSLPSQDAQSKINPATLSLSGTDPALLTTVFVENYRAQPCQIALLIFDPATGVPSEELLLVDGLMDVAALSDTPAKAADPTQPQVSTLTMSVTPRTVDLKRSTGRYANDSDQRLHRDANDGFFKDVSLVAVSKINWGLAGASSPSQAAAGSGVAGGGVLPPGVPVPSLPPVIF